MVTTNYNKGFIETFSNKTRKEENTK